MTDKANGLKQAREERSLKKRRAVESAIDELRRNGDPITFKAISLLARVSRQYLYNNFKDAIIEQREETRAEETIDGFTIPNRSGDEARHIEALLRKKIDRLKSELGDVRKENARLKQALEKERGRSEHFRNNWINASGNGNQK